MIVTYKQKCRDTLPIRNVSGAQTISNTPGISHIKMTVKKQLAILTDMTDGISLYLLKTNSDPYTIRVNALERYNTTCSHCQGQCNWISQRNLPSTSSVLRVKLLMFRILKVELQDI